ncbi:MAG TPA: helix-turn-helix transcriptional regulator [Thermoanaerobaculia bacterium]|nr:helix-turn-helix transcriptional regulator [Thermoanaerobaculia bacterium]
MESDAEREAVRLAVVLLRHLLGRSQREVGAISGVDQRHWSRYEKGLVMPRRPTLQRLFEIAGISASRLEQLLGVLGQVCEESTTTRVRTVPPKALKPLDLEEGQSLRQVALDLVEKLGPMILEAVAELEAFADSLVTPEGARRE